MPAAEYQPSADEANFEDAQDAGAVALDNDDLPAELPKQFYGHTSIMKDQWSANQRVLRAYVGPV